MRRWLAGKVKGGGAEWLREDVYVGDPYLSNPLAARPELRATLRVQRAQPGPSLSPLIESLKRGGSP